MKKRKKIFSVACNWDPKLLDGIERFSVYSVYGSLREESLSGGRLPYKIVHITEKKFDSYIVKTHGNGIKFSYLLNTVCTSNQEQKQSFKKRFIKRLKWLHSKDVDEVVLSMPYLAELARDNFPEMNIEVSALALVETPTQAIFWKEMGAKSICLSQSITRDVESIKAIRKAVSIPLKIIVNESCLQYCPWGIQHNLYRSHAKIRSGKEEDYCRLKCSKLFFSKPQEIIKTTFIRPEDLGFYSRLGINYFKIVDRLMPTSWLANAVKAYSNRKYEGNLLDLFPFYQKTIENTGAKQKEYIYIDNSKLGGLVDCFKEKNCRTQCGTTCKYCERIAKKAVKKHGSEKIAKKIKSKLDSLTEVPK